jgi:hypothetical protein
MAEIINCPMCGRPRASGYRCPSCGDSSSAQPAGPAPYQLANTGARGPAIQGPTGLGGWLVLPIIGLSLTVLMIVARTLSSTIPDLRSGVWDLFTNPGSELYHPLWAPLLAFEYAADAIMLIGSVILLVFLFQRKPILPKLMVGFYGFCLLFMVIDSLVIVWQGPEMLPDAGVRAEIGWTTASLLGGVAKAALSYAIWIPYFLVSKRVKNTFVEKAPLAPVVWSPGGQLS